MSNTNPSEIKTPFDSAVDGTIDCDLKDARIPHERWGDFMMAGEHMNGVLAAQQAEDRAVELALDHMAPACDEAIRKKRNKEILQRASERAEDIFVKAQFPFSKMRALHAQNIFERILEKVEWTNK